MSKNSEIRQKIREAQEQNELNSQLSINHRARSLTVGQCGGGMIEVMLRGDVNFLWYVVHPTEAVELIGQIAAAAGVEIAMRPREDFAAWRSWDPTLPGQISWLGAAPWQITDEDKEKIIAAKTKSIKTISAVEEKEDPKLLAPETNTPKRKTKKVVKPTEDES